MSVNEEAENGAVICFGVMGNSEVNFCNQAIAQACAFHSPFLGHFERYRDLA
jgi:hypothetical protein